MADFKCFMAENAVKAENRMYVASERFVQGGEPVPWELRVVSNDEIDKLRTQCTKKVFNKKTHEYTEKVDSEQFALELACQSVVYPDLNDAALQESYGVVGAEALVKKMLTPGEYADLADAVTETCGFQSTMKDKITTAKN